MPRLVFNREDNRLFEFPLKKAQNWIGRSDQCDLSLLGDEISRLHCAVERRASKWRIVDKSRHGTWLNERRCENTVLKHGDCLKIGKYQVVFEDLPEECNATAENIPSQTHTFVQKAGKSQTFVQRAFLILVDGQKADSKEIQRIPLGGSSLSVGNHKSDIGLGDEKLKAEHCRLRISRGRVMIEPGNGPVFLGGQRLTDITPILEGEIFRIGDSFLKVESVISKEISKANHFGAMLGGKNMRAVFGTLRQFAAHDFHVLITGESGTGKELAARAVHDSSHRAKGPFVAINCAGLNDSLIESELFGHVKGAFTGAVVEHLGAFHQARNGTLFLDELGELSLSAQSKLLRTLESGEVRRVGSRKVDFPDVRIIAATNADLNLKVQQGLFRSDLLYRLSVLSISLPPLRTRIEDLPILCQSIFNALNKRIKLSSCALQLLKTHNWPGNVRELRNVLTRAYVLSGGGHIQAKHISLRTVRFQDSVRRADPGGFDKENLKEMLKRHRGNRSAVARELGIARTTLLYRLKCLELVE